MVVAVLAAGFILWKKAREEHYDEFQFFDGFLLSLVAGFIAARIGFIILHASEFGFNLFRWFDVVGSPGLNWLFAALGATAFIARYAQIQKWDIFEVLDYWVTAISLSLVILWLGWWFAGLRFGYPTDLPWGMVFPNVVQPHQPTQLYAVGGYLLLFWYLSWLEYHYRTFEWYKARRKSAQTGFLVAVFLMGNGLLMAGLNLVMPAQLQVLGLRLDWVIAVVSLIAGVGVMVVRSGRTFGIRKLSSSGQE